MNEEVKRSLKKSGSTISGIIRGVLMTLGTIGLIIITTGAMMAVLFTVYITKHLDVDLVTNLGEFDLDLTSFIWYTDPDSGELVKLQDVHAVQNRIWIKYEDIPETMVEALISIEDQRFREHKGVDWKRTGGAFVTMFIGGTENGFGGSTITQQLIKNVTLDDEGTVRRKIQEILRALEFEKHYKKNEILEWYLNTCYFGQGSDGIMTAANTYFGKEPKDLTIAEQACIIGITNSPTRYNPYLNPEKNKVRQETILYKMFEQGYITEAAYEREKAQELVFVRNSVEYDTSPQSYFVDTVMREVTADYMAATKLSEIAAQQRLRTGGFSIYSTLNPRIQGIIDDVWQTDENWPVVRNSEKPQSAMTLMNPINGDVLGMAGGRGEKEGSFTFNRATQAKRQPGSSMKPVASYAPAFDAGVITPYSVIDEAPLNINGRSWPGSSYSGRMPVITAITKSTNTVAVRTLDLIGPQQGFDFARYNLHISTLVSEEWRGDKMFTDVTLSLALGGLTYGATTRDMTAAYAAFANRGVYNKPRTYTHVTDNDKNVVLDNAPVGQVAMQEKTAYYVTTCLLNAVQSGTGSKAKLSSGMPTAGKTGTTNDDKDRWFCGYTPYYASAVWFGFDQPKVIKLEQSTNPAITMWKLVMERIHEGLEIKEFSVPAGVKSASYCMDSGLSPTENCRMDPRGSRIGTGNFAEGDAPSKPCNVHTLASIDSASGHIATPYCPEETQARVALLNFGTRKGDKFGDEGYLVRTWSEENAGDPTTGELPYNAFCPLHRSAADVPVPPEEPFDPFDPLSPGDVTTAEPLDPLNPISPINPEDTEHTPDVTPMVQ